jgi:hypothetical protein
MIKTAQGWATYDTKQWFNTFQEAQQYSTTNKIAIEIAPEDKYPSLQKLADKLPQKWFLTLGENAELVIYSPQTIYTYFENKINAPVFLGTDKSEFTKKNGTKTYPHITYTLKKPLTESEKKEIEQKNALLTQKIEQLPKKHNIHHLKPVYNHGKDVYPDYPDATKEEKKRIQAYQKESEALRKMYLPTPMYSTPEFDLWNEVIVGVESMMESVYPESASEETFKVLQIIRSFFSQK